MLRWTWAAIHLHYLRAEHYPLRFVNGLLSAEFVGLLEATLYIVARRAWAVDFRHTHFFTSLAGAPAPLACLHEHTSRACLFVRPL